MPPGAGHPVTMATPQPTVSTWQSQHSDATGWPALPALRLPKAQRRDHSRGKPVRVSQGEGSMGRGPNCKENVDQLGNYPIDLPQIVKYNSVNTE